MQENGEHSIDMFPVIPHRLEPVLLYRLIELTRTLRNKNNL